MQAAVAQEVSAGVAEVEVSMVITRANGTIEDKGIVSYYNQDPKKQAAWDAEHGHHPITITQVPQRGLLSRLFRFLRPPKT